MVLYFNKHKFFMYQKAIKVSHKLLYNNIAMGKL